MRAVAILLSLVAPYTAEEMWQRQGHAPTVVRAGWPEVAVWQAGPWVVTAVGDGAPGSLRPLVEALPRDAAAGSGGWWRRAGAALASFTR